MLAGDRHTERSTVDLVIIPLVALAGLLVALLVWRPHRGRRRNLEEALEADALRREQERNVRDAQVAADHLRR
jgi:flagellar biosynthesis/type III secretory pathway M-ring protein FliF/YscJ